MEPKTPLPWLDDAQSVLPRKPSEELVFGFGPVLSSVLKAASQGRSGRWQSTMFMQHRVLRKGMGPNQMAGSIENIFRLTNVALVGQDGHWRLGQSGSALILVQVLGISDRECFVITVAASPD